jgi:hypothetical protein
MPSLAETFQGENKLKNEVKTNIDPGLRSFLDMVIKNCVNSLPEYQPELTETVDMETARHYFDVLHSAIANPIPSHQSPVLILENGLNQKGEVLQTKLVLKTDIENQDESFQNPIHMCGITVEPIKLGFNIIYSLSTIEIKKDKPDKSEEPKKDFDAIKLLKHNVQKSRKLIDLNIKLCSDEKVIFYYRIYSGMNYFRSEDFGLKKEKDDNPVRKGYKSLSRIILPKF